MQIYSDIFRVRFCIHVCTPLHVDNRNKKYDNILEQIKDLALAFLSVVNGGVDMFKGTPIKSESTGSNFKIPQNTPPNTPYLRITKYTDTREVMTNSIINILICEVDF